MEQMSPHTPVLPQEVLDQLLTRRTGPFKIIDGTLGYAGHSERFLRENPEATLLGIDRDEDALAFARKRLDFAKDRVTLVHGCYSDMVDFAEEHHFTDADAILLDIGVSSAQIDIAERGFSIRNKGPLDMRMNRQDSRTASQLLNRIDEDELVYILKEYGEIRSARKLASAIIEYRQRKLFETTDELVAVCSQACGKEGGRALPVATLCFQAIRIAINDELGELTRALPDAVSLLKVGGRVGVISFHSLEDRIVKQFFVESARECICPPRIPVCRCNHHATLKIVSRKPIMASREECRENHRANCAKFRVAEKI